VMQATVRDVAAWCGATFDTAAGGTMLAGVSTDTRSLAPGQLFIPLAGERFDGHDYLDAARRAGAAASLWSRSRKLPDDPGLPLLLVDDTLAALQQLAAGYLSRLNATVVAITGSNGKTTTKDMVASVLAVRYRVHKTVGNLNNEIGLPLTILAAPEATEVLVLEMGMSGRGEIALLTRLARPRVAVITNVGESHLLQLGSRRNIARAKLEIVEGLQPGGLLVMNGDEPLLKEEISRIACPDRLRVQTYGESPACDWKAEDIEIADEWTRFSVRAIGADEAEDTHETYEVPVPGKHNALNAIAAIAVGRRLGLDREQILGGLRAVKLTGMRIERLRTACGAVLLNDAYNASPTSVRAAIALLAELQGYRCKRLVLGDMLELGPQEAEMHAAIGRLLSPEVADFVYAFGPLSGHLADAARPAFPAGRVRHFADKHDLAATLLRETGQDDLVLFKASRGMKLEEIVDALIKGGVG